MSTITERVSRGAALLDERRPDWWQAIDLTELELSDCKRCVLGQMFGCEGADDFDIALESVGIAWAGDRYGFEAATSDFNNLSATAFGAAVDADFDALTAEWRKVITERRAA